MLSRLFFVLLFLPSVAFAQTGSTLPVESEVVREDRAFRLKSFSGSLAASKIIETQFAKQRETYFRKRAEYRRECREDLRRANKTTLMKTLLRCYGSEMSWLKDYAKKQKDYLSAVAGVIPVSRTAAVGRVDVLIDAIDTILFATDSGVYETKDDVLEVKKNFYSKYQKPLGDAWVTVRIDRTLTWIAHVLLHLDRLRSEELALEEDRQELVEARTCLTTQETVLRSLLQSTDTKRGDTLVGVMTALKACVKNIQTITRLEGEGSPPSP